MQLLALTAKSSELLDFDSATCSNAIERHMTSIIIGTMVLPAVVPSKPIK